MTRQEAAPRHTNRLINETSPWPPLTSVLPVYEVIRGLQLPRL